MDPKTIRLDDSTNPDRNRDFNAAVQVAGGNGNAIIRALVDAYVEFVREHGHGPGLPLVISSKPRAKPRRR